MFMTPPSSVRTAAQSLKPFAESRHAVAAGIAATQNRISGSAAVSASMLQSTLPALLGGAAPSTSAAVASLVSRLNASAFSSAFARAASQLVLSCAPPSLAPTPSFATATLWATLPVKNTGPTPTNVLLGGWPSSSGAQLVCTLYTWAWIDAAPQAVASTAPFSRSSLSSVPLMLALHPPSNPNMTTATIWIACAACTSSSPLLPSLGALGSFLATGAGVVSALSGSAAGLLAPITAASGSTGLSSVLTQLLSPSPAAVTAASGPPASSSDVSGMLASLTSLLGGGGGATGGLGGLSGLLTNFLGGATAPPSAPVGAPPAPVGVPPAPLAAALPAPPLAAPPPLASALEGPPQGAPPPPLEGYNSTSADAAPSQVAPGAAPAGVSARVILVAVCASVGGAICCVASLILARVFCCTRSTRTSRAVRISSGLPVFEPGNPLFASNPNRIAPAPETPGRADWPSACARSEETLCLPSV